MSFFKKKNSLLFSLYIRCVSAYLVEMNGAMASAPMAAVFVPLPPLFMAMIISIMNATV